MIIVPKRIDLIKQLPPGSVGAEIGVCRGHFSIEILNETSVKHLYLVDAWLPQRGYVDPLSNTDHEANLAECKHHLRGHPDRWTIVRGNSLDVARRSFPWEIPELDWFFLDADHSYEACLADLIAWHVRLKPTGVILGHDYTDNDQAQKWNFGVIKAVTEFCRDYGWTLTKLSDEDFASYQLERNK